MKTNNVIIKGRIHKFLLLKQSDNLTTTHKQLFSSTIKICLFSLYHIKLYREPSLFSTLLPNRLHSEHMFTQLQATILYGTQTYRYEPPIKDTWNKGHNRPNKRQVSKYLPIKDTLARKQWVPWQRYPLSRSSTINNLKF